MTGRILSILNCVLWIFTAITFMFSDSPSLGLTQVVLGFTLLGVAVILNRLEQLASDIKELIKNEKE